VENLTIRRGQGALLLAYAGEMTLEVVPGLKRTVEAELASDEVSAIVLDLSGVEFMDSSGIGFLVSMQTRMRAAGKAFHLVHLSVKVRKTLNLVQLLTYFSVIEKEEDLAALVS
jgi:anti-sigma B factor antagonist